MDNGQETLAKWRTFLEYKERADNQDTRGAIQTSGRDWHPLRYATREGWILGAWTWRTKRTHAEVGLFVCEDHHLYKPGSALNWSLRCIFTQAFYQTGSMGVRFIGLSEEEATLDSGFEPTIPKEIVDFAKTIGLQFRYGSRILHSEACELYYHITEFSRELIDKFKRKSVDPIWPCVLVQRAVWSESQIRHIFDHANNAGAIFEGGEPMIDSCRYNRDLQLLRLVVAQQRLQNILQKSSGQPEDGSLSEQWSRAFVVNFQSVCELQISTASGSPWIVSAGQRFSVAMLPRTESEYRLFHDSDIKVASRVDLVCVTRDFLSSGLEQTCGNAEAVVLFDTIDQIDQDVDRRLANTSGSKFQLAERHR